MNLPISLNAGDMFPENQVAYPKQSGVLGQLRPDICSLLGSFHNWAIQDRSWKDFCGDVQMHRICSLPGNQGTNESDSVQQSE